MFVVTGRKEDVCAAKKEILSAAEHFSQIRASRRNSSVSSVGSNNSTGLAPGPPSPNAPGQVTIQVRVPYRVVGLVVGPKGATIKRIQQQTHTYIVTPSRDKEPVFEVTGLPENVERSRQEIESHIATRTGGLVDTSSLPPNANADEFHTNGLDSGFHELNGGGGDFMGSIYKTQQSSSTSSSGSAFTSYGSGSVGSNGVRRVQEPTIFNFPPVNNTTTITNNTNGHAKLGEFTTPMSNGYGGGGGGFSAFGVYENNDEGIGSPSFDPIPPSPSMWPDFGDNHSHLVSLFGGGSSSANSGSGNSPPCMNNIHNNNSNSSSSSNNSPRRSSSFAGGSSSRISPPTLDNNGSCRSVSPLSNTNLSCSSTGGTTSPGEHHPLVRRIRSDPLTNGMMNGFAGTSTTSVSLPGCCYTTTTMNGMSSSTSSGSPTSCSPGNASPIPTLSSDAIGCGGGVLGGVGVGGGVVVGLARPRKHCMICSESNVVAALVPCGHNVFCMECAGLIMGRPAGDRFCPVCQQTPTQAIRIFS